METLHKELVGLVCVLSVLLVPIVWSALSMAMDINRLLKEFRQWRFYHDNDV